MKWDLNWIIECIIKSFIQFKYDENNIYNFILESIKYVLTLAYCSVDNVEGWKNRIMLIHI